MATILLIDDDQSLRTMMAHVLRRVGHSVVEACDGKVGLDIFRQANADLVITDMVMPEKEGFEVLIELRKRQPSLKVIAMSGGGLQKPTDNLRMARHLGAKVLLKPFSTAVLISTVNEMLPGALQEQKPAAL